MENTVNELIDNISEHVKSLTKTETIIGDEFTLGEHVCKPVIKVGVGFGSAGGNGTHPKAKTEGSGRAGGAGIGIAPVGFLVSKGEEVTFISAEKNNALSAALEKVPDIVDRFMNKKEETETKEETKKDKK